MLRKCAVWAGGLALLVLLILPLATVHADGPLTNRWGPQTGRYGIVASGVGMTAAPSNTITLDVPGTPVQAYLYWAGYDTNNPGDGDDTVDFARNPNATTPVTALETFGPDYWVDVNMYHYVYVADVTAFIASGAQTYTVADFNFVASTAVRYGAGLLVVYEDPNLPVTQVEIRDGLDALYH